MKMNLNFNYDFFCALVLMKQEHHDGGTGTGGEEPTSTQAPPDAARSLAESGKTKCL